MTNGEAGGARRPHDRQLSLPGMDISGSADLAGERGFGNPLKAG